MLMSGEFLQAGLCVCVRRNEMFMHVFPGGAWIGQSVPCCPVHCVWEMRICGLRSSSVVWLSDDQAHEYLYLIKHLFLWYICQEKSSLSADKRKKKIHHNATIKRKCTEWKNKRFALAWSLISNVKGAFMVPILSVNTQLNFWIRQIFVNLPLGYSNYAAHGPKCAPGASE